VAGSDRAVRLITEAGRIAHDDQRLGLEGDGQRFAGKHGYAYANVHAAGLKQRSCMRPPLM
jgi:hypothetical protein